MFPAAVKCKIVSDEYHERHIRIVTIPYLVGESSALSTTNSMNINSNTNEGHPTSTYIADDLQFKLHAMFSRVCGEVAKTMFCGNIPKPVYLSRSCEKGLWNFIFMSYVKQIKNNRKWKTRNTLAHPTLPRK